MYIDFQIIIFFNSFCNIWPPAQNTYNSMCQYMSDITDVHTVQSK